MGERSQSVKLPYDASPILNVLAAVAGTDTVVRGDTRRGADRSALAAFQQYGAPPGGRAPSEDGPQGVPVHVAWRLYLRAGATASFSRTRALGAENAAHRAGLELPGNAYHPSKRFGGYYAPAQEWDAPWAGLGLWTGGKGKEGRVRRE